MGLGMDLQQLEGKQEESEQDYQLFLPLKHPHNPSYRPPRAPPAPGSDCDSPHLAAEACRPAKPHLKTSSGPFKL